MRRLAVVSGMTALAGCSLFLDFDLTGGSATTPPAEAGASIDGALPPEGGSDARPPFPSFNCQEFQLCDDFERRNTTFGGVFNRTIGDGIVLTRDPLRVASDEQSLEVVRPATTVRETALLLSDDNAGLSDNALGVQFLIALEYDVEHFEGERTLLLIIPAANLADPNVTEGVSLRVRPDGIFAQLTVYTPAAILEMVRIDPLRLADGKWHALAIDTRFDDSRGRLKVTVDGSGDGLPEISAVDTLDKVIPTRLSLAFGASASADAGASQIKVRFDNLRVRL